VKLTVIGLVAVAQWFLGRNLITAEGVTRVRGFYGSPNNLALYLGRALPLALALGLWGRNRRRRVLYGLGAVGMVIAIVLTYSRGAWLLGIPASLLFLAAVRGRRTLLLMAGSLLVIGAVGLALVGPDRLVTLADSDQGTAFLRIQLWRSSWAMIRDHPILGIGLDNFLYFYRSAYVLPTAWEELNLSHPHNIVLDFWLRLGLAGLLLVGWVLVSFFRLGWRAYRLVPVGDTRLLVVGLMAGMVDVLAHGLVDSAFFLVDLAFAFALMLALAQAITGWSLSPAAERQME
jgi:O-antigen ligase